MNWCGEPRPRSVPLLALIRLVVVLVFLGAACAHSPLPRPTVSPAPPAPWYGDLRVLAERAARVRGLELTRTFEIVPLDDAEFFARYDGLRKAANPIQNDLARTLEVLSPRPGAERPLDWDENVRAARSASQAQVKQVREEQLIAFYEFDTHTLVVRRDKPASLGLSPSLLRATLAHEVGHVLQDQRGLGVPRPKAFDEALAWRAVLEGDATLTGLLVGADLDDLSPRRAVERARLVRTTLTEDQVDGAVGESPVLLKAAPMVREMFSFPYRGGEHFVTDLYAAGGLDLVDRMLLAPPTSTDLILAPERYLAGGGPRTARVSEAARRLGVVVTRGLLRTCNEQLREPVPAKLVTWVGASMVDDSLERRGDGYVWLTTWDTSETARQAPAEDAEEQRGVTLKLAALALKAIAECMGAAPQDVTTEARGVSVALTVRRPDDAALRVALPRPPMARAPFGAVTVPEPRLALAFHNPGQGRLVGPRWEHAPLSLTLDWFDGAKLLDNPAAALSAAAPGLVLLGSYLDEGPEDAKATAFLNVVAGICLKSAKVAGGVPMTTRYEWKDVTTRGAAAKETTLRRGKVTIRARAYPMCAGRAVLYVVGMSLDPSNEATLTQWQDSLSFTGAAPACDR